MRGWFRQNQPHVYQYTPSIFTTHAKGEGRWKILRGGILTVSLPFLKVAAILPFVSPRRLARPAFEIPSITTGPSGHSMPITYRLPCAWVR